MISSNQLAPSLKLFLLRLMFSSDWLALKEIKPAITRNQRLLLEKSMKLIEVEKQGRALHTRLSEHGWKWCRDHLHEPLGVQRNTAAEILEEALGAIHSILCKHDWSLAQILLRDDEHSVPPSPSAANSRLSHGSVPAETPTEEHLPDRIRHASLSLGGGASRVRVPLSQLRARLSEVPNKELDQTLILLARQGRLQLMPYDNPLEITSKDREAELVTPSGEARHLVYWLE